jgi:hypothetical protein
MRSLKYLVIIILLFFYYHEDLRAQEGLDFSNVSIDKFIVIGNIENKDENKLMEILLAGIEISIENIVNSNTTRTSYDLYPYRYKYLVIFPDLSYSIEEKDIHKKIYDPTHPDAITVGEMAGYTLYPDIDVEREYNDIIEFINFIRSLKTYFPPEP